jgi:hypothetical protein
VRKLDGDRGVCVLFDGGDDLPRVDSVVGVEGDVKGDVVHSELEEDYSSDMEIIILDGDGTSDEEDEYEMVLR